MYKTVMNVGIPTGKMNWSMDCVLNAALIKSMQVTLIGQGMIKKKIFFAPSARAALHYTYLGKS